MSRFLLCMVVVSFAFFRQGFAERWVPFGKQFQLFVEKEERTIRFFEQRRGDIITVSAGVPGMFVDNVRAKKRDFASLRIPGEGFTTIPGQARIPVIRRLIRVPGNSQVSVVDVDASFELYKMSDLDLRGKIFPVQRSHSKGDRGKPRFVIESSYYRVDDFSSTNVVKIGKTFRIRGETYRMLEIFPLIYNPSRNLLKVISGVRVRLRVDGSSLRSKPSYPVKGLMIVYGDAFKDSAILGEFASWKKRLGFSVKTVPVSSIGSTDREIRDYLVSEYRNWRGPYLDYLLIIGDVEHVPSHRGSGGGKSQYTDNYYATLDTDSYIDDLTTPDIAVGRIAVKDGGELSIVLNKILKYERADFGTFDWIKKISFVGTSDTAWYKVAEGTHNHVIDNHTTGKGFNGIFPENPMVGGDRLYAISHKARTEDLLRSFNDGRVIINYSGHGGTTSWAGPNFNREDIEAIDHPDALPYVVSNACITGSFASSSDSFSEMWLKAARGAIGFWGASNSSYWDEDDILEKRMWDHLFRDGAHRIGDINFYGMTELRRHYNNSGKVPYYYEIYNLIGDPTVSLYTEIPESMIISAEPILVGIDQVKIKVEDSNGPVAGANIFLEVRAQELSSLAVTDESGIAVFQFDTSGLVPGKATVMASGVNHIPGSKEINIISPEGPYFLVEDYQTNEADGQVNPMDRFQVTFRIKNVGRDSGSPHLEIAGLPSGVIATGAVGQGCDGVYLGAGESSVCNGSYGFFVNRVVNDGTVFKVKLVATDGDYRNDLYFSFPVHYAKYEIPDVQFEEVSGNLNGNPDPGEYIDFIFTVRNTGSSVSSVDQLEMELLDTCLSSVSGSRLDLPPLAPEESVSKRFHVKVAESCPNGSVTDFIVRVRSGHDTNFVFVEPSFQQIIGTKSEITVVSDEELSVPDNDSQGVTSEIEISELFKVDTVKVFVDIQHTYRGDLILVLKAPDETAVVLHKRTGGGGDNLYGWYGDELSSFEDLAALGGVLSKGKWTLKVSDHARNDEGYLRSWKLSIAGYAL